MPKPKADESEKDFVSRCIPMVMNDGTASDNKQAAAICYSMYKQHTKKSIKAEESLGDKLDSIYRAFNVAFPQQMTEPAPMSGGYVDEVYSDFVIVCLSEQYYKVSYSMDADGNVTFAPQSEWQKVTEETNWIPSKSTPTESANAEQVAELSGDDLVGFGGAIKATALPDGSVKLYGPLVTFSDASSPDLTGDFFVKDTDFGDAQECDVYFNHRLPVRYGETTIEYKAKLGKAKLTKTDAAIFAETILSARNEYEKAIIDAGLAGKLGWSSGTAAHLVDREAVGNVFKIKKWDLGLDASLTPTPAEPRNSVIPLKSLGVTTAIKSPEGKSEATEVATSEGGAAENKKEQNKMTDTNEVKGITPEMLQQAVKDAAKEAAGEAVKAFQAAAPAPDTAGVKVTKDEADQEFKSAGEFFMAVKSAAVSPSQTDKRLLGLKATGMNEAVPSQGGFLVPPQIAAGIRERMYSTGSMLGQFPRDPVTGNSMTYNAVDETSRADGYRYGGVQGYWMAEAGTKTSSKPTFRQIELKLKKVAALCVATDELLEDAAALQSWLNRTVPNELRFKVEDAIVNGDGVGKPIGIVNSPAYLGVARETAGSITAGDLGTLWSRRWAGYSDYIWLGSQTIFPKLLSMTIGQMPVFLAAGGVSNLPYSTLLGRPYFETEYNAVLGDPYDLLLVSPSAYPMIEKSGGIQTASSIHVYFTTDESAFRFVYRVDGAPDWNTTLTLKDGSTTVSPFVGLTSSS